MLLGGKTDKLFLDTAAKEIVVHKYTIKTMNVIAREGLDLLGDEYDVSPDITKPGGILVRSAKVDTDDYPGLLAVARAGSGVNNISVEKATEKGICVFNTPGANANAVVDLVFPMVGRRAGRPAQIAGTRRADDSGFPGAAAVGPRNSAGGNAAAD